MIHTEAEGFRPVFDERQHATPDVPLSICPGFRVNGDLETAGIPKARMEDHEFGPTLEIWEGWATDTDLRYRGSSGGILSALSLYCLEIEGFAGVLHAGMDPTSPWRNRNYLSRHRKDVVDRAGSRYVASAPCADLGYLDKEAGVFGFIGKPCDVAAVNELRRIDATLDNKLGLVATFFCAGTPSAQGTLDLIDRLPAAREKITSVRYRGDGWPGQFRVCMDDGDSKSLSYEESWAHLTNYRPLRCHLCPDGLGRCADISCGDAWHRKADGTDPGRSLVLVRTERGRSLLERARRKGYVTLQRADVESVMQAQAGLLRRRRELFGRLLAFQILGIPVPSYSGFSLWRSWAGIGPRRQLATMFGTLQRILHRRLFRPRDRALAPARATATD